MKTDSVASKTEWLAFVSILLVGLVGSSCQTTPRPMDTCGGGVESIDERDYCVYKRSNITETGFQCPDGYPHRHNLGSTVTCSRSPDDIPDEHKGRIKRKYSTKADTGLLPDRGEVGSDADSGRPSDADSGNPSDVDGGDTTGGETDVGPDAPDALSRSNACQDPAYKEYRNRTEAPAEDFKIPWKVVSNGGTSLPDTFDATWKGVQTLGSTVTFDCPPTASDLGLNCTTDKALVFERANTAATRVEVAVALPVQSINFPATGTSVEVAMRSTFGSYDNQHPLGFSIKRTSDDRFVFVIRGEIWDNNQMGLQATHGPVDVAIDTQIDDPASAFCITQTGCPKVYRLEPLAVTTMSRQSVNPGTSVTFTGSNGAKHRFWHLISMRRSYGNTRGWPKNFCTDAQSAFAMYAYGMVK